jgi:hypothetical protein
MRAQTLKQIRQELSLAAYKTAAPFSLTAARRYRRATDKARWKSAGCDLPTFERQAILIPETNSVYVGVPKSGHTSMKTAISSKRPAIATDVHAPRFPGLGRFSEIGLPASDIVDGRYCAFTMVREPLKRFASTYQNTRRNHCTGAARSNSLGA